MRKFALTCSLMLASLVVAPSCVTERASDDVVTASRADSELVIADEPGPRTLTNDLVQDAAAAFIVLACGFTIWAMARTTVSSPAVVSQRASAPVTSSAHGLSDYWL